MTSHREPRRRPDLALAGLVVLDLVVRLAGALRPLRFLDGLTIPDDAYLSLTIARNLARGLGPWFGTGPTSGFQPLYVVLATPLCALFPHDTEAPVRAALLLLVAADVIALVLLYRFLRHVLTTRFAAAAAALAWVLSPYALHTTLNGLETTLAFSTLVALFYSLERACRAGDAATRGPRLVATGALLALAMFARVDAIVAAPVLALALVSAARTRGARVAAGARDAALALVVALVVYSPWALWLHSTTGDWLPVSGAALHAMGIANVHHEPGLRSMYLPLALRALDVIVRRNAFPIAMLGLLAIVLAVLRVPAASLRERLRPAAPAAMFSAILVVTYVAWLNAGWYYPRYFFPLLLPLLLALGAAVDAAAVRLAGAPGRRALAAVLVLLVVAGNVVQPPLTRTFRSRNDQTLGYRNAGLWARERFPAGTVIGGLQCGAIAWFADSLVVVNLDGVVNRAAYEALLHRQLGEYLRESGIRYLLGMRDDPGYIRAESMRPRSDDLVPLGRMGRFTTGPDPWFAWRVGPEGSEADPVMP